MIYKSLLIFIIQKYINTVAATDENLTGENWELILTVTDKLFRASPER
jgi:hypothetical protein